jgi:hypothetical protein
MMERRRRGARRAGPLLWGGLLSIGMVFLGLGGAFVATAPSAAAAPAPITQYASFPAPLPPGCPGGPAALVDPVWSNGRGGVENDLRRLDLTGGDDLTLTWSGFASGCLGPSGVPAVTVSLTAYDAGPVSNPLAFDPSIDQHLLVSTSCGVDAGPCTLAAGRYTMSLTIPGPSPDMSCNLQAGGVLGLPLAVVGPNGSFYSPLLRGDNGPALGIGDTNFGMTGCEAGVSPTTVVGTSTTVPASTSTSVPSNTGSSTSSTVPGSGVSPTSVVGSSTTVPSTTGPSTTVPPTTMPVTSTSSGAEVSPTSVVGSSTTLPSPSTSTTMAVTSTSSGAEVSPNSVVATSAPGGATTTTIPTEVEAATVSRAQGGALPLTGPQHTGQRTAAGVALAVVGGLLLGAGNWLRRVNRRRAA